MGRSAHPAAVDPTRGEMYMADHRARSAARLRTIGRGSAVVAGGVFALSALGAGSALADEGYSAPDDETTTTTDTAEDPGFIPTSPVDGIANHWMNYHYKEANFAQDEVGRITSDPQRYIDIHLDMVAEMLGQGGGESSHGDY
jgi:hypothetical protein